MAFQHYRDCLFKIDDTRMFVDDITISTNASIEPVIKQGSKRPEYLNNSGPIKTSVNLSYYITGFDPLKNYINDQYSVVSGDFAGYYFPSGYLTSYSLNVRPNSPIKVSATIDVFDDLKGSYTANTSGESPKVLNYVNAVLTQMTSDYSTESFINADQISYNYSLNTIAEYINCTGDSGKLPYRVIYGEKTLSMSVESDNTKMSLPTTGDPAGLILKIYDNQINQVMDYQCSGTVTSRDIKVSAGNELRTTYKIEQYEIMPPPVISGYSTSTHGPNRAIAFYGSNLQSIKTAKVGEYFITNIRYENGNVTGEVSPYATSGDLYVSTDWGEFKSTIPIPSWTYPDITISSITPDKAYAGDKILISGDNFYDISSVKFYNDISSEFRVLTSKAISATVPDSATIGVINVASSKRNKNANTASFTPYPVVTSFSPINQTVGSDVTIVGTNFSNIDDVKFNTVSASAFSVDSATQITATVPDGDNAGLIKLETTYSHNIYSPYEFYPNLSISSITKANTKGSIGETITLNLSQNASAGMLYTTGDSLYMVQFGGYDAVGFSLASATTLQGKIPDNALTGPVHVIRSDGASVYGDGFWLEINPEPPVISKVTPTRLFKTGNSSINFTVNGLRVKDLENVFLFGGYTNEDGTISTEKVTFVDGEFSEDIFGTNVVVHNNTKMSSTEIGLYDVVVSGAYLGAGLPVLKDTLVKAIEII